MATIRHMAMNLLQGAKDKHSLKVRRKSAAWDTTYLEVLRDSSKQGARLPHGSRTRPSGST